MSWESEFEEFYNDEVTRQEYTGQDGYGQPTHGTAVTHYCRVVYKPQLLRFSGAGEVQGTVREVVSTAQIFVKSIVGWNLRDKVTMPDGTSPPILQIVTYPDEDGPHHEVIFV
jgi:hypothetical protein